ncbi:MAG: tRNA guanosine(34) transglycosylase Tgt [Deltaproteobacteria bacterium]|nr:tRNA guanosine(34) transglycosylase Tgt [Deltaproteobacteria bacterium]
MPFTFRTLTRDPGCAARSGVVETSHGRIETPAFMPVGTRGTVTTLTPDDLRALDAQIILGNTYHLLLRPGPETMRHFGGLHRFMAWDRPILTDSGGFQIFSLPADRTLDEEGARFKSYVDCRYHHLTPESSIAMQEAIGSDVMMVLDICVPSTAEPGEIRLAMERTHRWALRSLVARRSSEQALFAIVQGGLCPEWRAESAAFLSQHPFDGFAIGGLAVGDTRSERFDVVGSTAARLPADRPRYLMGVGTPPDILEGIAQGVDMFDCVLPSTLAWQGIAFTSTGRVKLLRTEHRLSDAPLDAACSCPACTAHPRGYLHHLFKCKETLGHRLLSIHNLHHYLSLMRAARQAIEQGRFSAFQRQTLAAIDRHEHDATARPPGRTCRAPATARFEIITTESGAASIRDREAGEVMHPTIGAAQESRELYVVQSRLFERLSQETAKPLVVFDVGLGAAGNALAAMRAARELAQRRPLELVSFERELGALRLAASDEGAARLGWTEADRLATGSLLKTGRHEEPGIVWRLVHGDIERTLPALGSLAHVVFWDPFSPKANPGLWSAGIFPALRATCAPDATVFTYSNATSTRGALLLAGFFVGHGLPSGAKEETTTAAVRLQDLARPLDRRWLGRLERSTVPFPADAPPDALQAVRGHPQFAE